MPKKSSIWGGVGSTLPRIAERANGYLGLEKGRWVVLTGISLDANIEYLEERITTTEEALEHQKKALRYLQYEKRHGGNNAET